MPTDPKPEGQGILNKTLVKPFPEPTSGKRAQGERSAREEAGAADSLVSPDMEEPAETNRPPLGN